MRISDWSSDVCSSDLVVLLLIVGMFEVAVIMFVNVSVEGALREAARFGITGEAPAGVTREQAIVDTVERYTFGFVDMDEAEISRSEEHTSELQSLMRISYAVFCLKKNKTNNT